MVMIANLLTSDRRIILMHLIHNCQSFLVHFIAGQLMSFYLNLMAVLVGKHAGQNLIPPKPYKAKVLKK